MLPFATFDAQDPIRSPLTFSVCAGLRSVSRRVPMERMFDRPIAAFDIETIPDPDIGRRVLGLQADDGRVVREMVRRRLEETEGSSEYPQLPWQRVLCVCATALDPEAGRATIRELGGDAMGERSHIEGFYRLVAYGDAPRLVSWSGGGFDLPVLRYRAMMHGIAAPELYRVDGDRRWNNYQNRYHELHTDVMDSLSGFGASMRIGLDTMSRVLGMPGKAFLDRPIYDHVLEGDEARLVEYCKLDTVETLLVFLAWAHHTGELPTERLRRFVDGVRAAVAALSYPGWRQIEAGLEGWPAWAHAPREGSGVS